MKTLKEIFASHDYGNTEWEQSFAPMLTEWLTEKLKDNECCAECDIINRFIKIELLEELR